VTFAVTTVSLKSRWNSLASYTSCCRRRISSAFAIDNWPIGRRERIKHARAPGVIMPKLSGF
jgi:hypothetical protein